MIYLDCLYVVRTNDGEFDQLRLLGDLLNQCLEVGCVTSYENGRYIVVVPDGILGAAACPLGLITQGQ